MVVPQLVELDIFLEAFERGVAGELLEAGDVDTLRDAARDRAAPQAVAGKRRRVKPGEAGPVLDDQRDRIGVDRTGTNPVAVGYRLSPCNPWKGRGGRRQMRRNSGPSVIAAAASQASSAATGQRSVRPSGTAWCRGRPGRSCATAGTARCRPRGV
jgi:hypothetical protein